MRNESDTAANQIQRQGLELLRAFTLRGYGPTETLEVLSYALGAVAATKLHGYSVEGLQSCEGGVNPDVLKILGPSGYTLAALLKDSNEIARKAFLTHSPTAPEAA